MEQRTRSLSGLAITCLSWLLAIAGIVIITMAVKGALGQNDAVARADVGLSDLAGTIKVLPNPATVSQGEEVKVWVWVEDIGNWYGLEFGLTYDPAVVRIDLDETHPGEYDVHSCNDVFGDEDLGQSSRGYSVDNVAGETTYFVININPALPVTTTGRICCLHFEALASGTAQIDFSYAKAGTRDGVALYPAQESGQVQSAAPTPVGVLQEGWNCVSFANDVADPELHTVLDGISGQYDAVLAWEPSTPTDPWRHWYEGAPRYVLEPTLDNALVAVDESMGLWLRTTEAVTLTVEGPELSGGYCIPLTKGWNLVGYPAQEAHFVETAMGPVLGYVEAVVADDTPDLTYNGLVWQRETYETRDDLNTLNHMQPGRGYWVNVNADCIWCVPFDGSGY